MTTMTTPQITPTPDAVKLARALATDICVGHIAEARDWEKTRDTIAALILPVLTAQQADHAATVARLERERDELRGKADACWGAANYRLKYIGCLFRAAGLDDSDPLENRIGAAAEHIEKLVADLSAARAEVERLAKVIGINKTDTEHIITSQRENLVDLRARLAAAEADTKEYEALKADYRELQKRMMPKDREIAKLTSQVMLLKQIRERQSAAIDSARGEGKG